MKRTVRLSFGGGQMVRDILGGRLMQAYVFACVGYYILLVFSNIVAQADLIWGLGSILVQGILAAESLILYQRKESKNLRHLSLFCLIAGIVMALVCLFLGSVVVSLNMGYSAKTEEVLQLWAEENLAAGMPYMIVSVIFVGVEAAALLTLRPALSMSADMLDRKGASRNWYLPAAILLSLSLALSVGMTAINFSMNWLDISVTVLEFARNACAALLMFTASREFRAKTA